MDDGQLWEDMTRRGAPVAHCRAKVAQDRDDMRARRVKEAARLHRRALEAR